MDMFSYIKIDQNSRVPKYKQIINSIKENISNGNLKIDKKVPSINMLSEEYNISRDTVEKAYSILKMQKIISPIKGKGYYITRTELISKINVIFLINKLSNYKMEVYNSFINSLKIGVHTDLHIYQYDESVFVNLLKKNIGVYDYFILMTHFKSEESKYIDTPNKVIDAIKNIPKDKLVLLDNRLELGNDLNYIQIYQDFENDIYNALVEAIEKISKYKKLILIYPKKCIYPHPTKILQGFRKFCVEYSIDFEILNELFEDTILKKGDLFITLLESDLVNLVRQIRDGIFVLGEDIGIISYNDTPLKELLDIAVISTDFVFMGEITAKMIIDHEKGSVKNPFYFIDRSSI